MEAVVIYAVVIVVAVLVGVPVGFGLSLVLAVVVGYPLLLLDRLLTSCLGCGGREMRWMNFTRVFNAGPRSYYACDTCHRRWCWFHQERVWHDARRRFRSAVRPGTVA